MKLNRKILAVTVGVISCGAVCRGQNLPRPEFVYDIGFELRFDNREYDRSSYSPSGTIFGTRLYPSVGLKLDTGDAVHTIAAGAEIRKDFGDINTIGKELLKDFFYYYSFRTHLGEGMFTIDGGVFPRVKCREQWSTAFFSEKHLWYDPYIEGMLFRYEKPGLNVELGCDWMGMYGSDTTVNEQFMIFSAGHWDLSRIFRLGYNFYMVHFANSVTVRGVCDNILAEPYLTADFSPLMPMVFDKCSLKLGYLQSAQRDRTKTSDFQTPALTEVSAKLSKRGFSVQNSFYAGSDIMPLYSRTDAAGTAFGDRLYFGDPYLRIYDSEDANSGYYDRLEMSYSTMLGRKLNIKFAWVMHFNSGIYSGCQQIVTLNYALGRK